MTMLTNCLWLDDQAEEAARFYTGALRDGKVGRTTRYNESVSETAGRPVGSVMTVEFEAEGAKFMLLNGGPLFQPNEAISFVVERDTQEELDETWDALLEGGGTESQCGWLKDRYGFSWQVTPSNLDELMGEGEGAERASAALMKMVKIDIDELRRARDGETSSV
jgi:predicted 3-demethylubiquinone-9 3-methyltransferase (glyoxalase superfamily)